MQFKATTILDFIGKILDGSNGDVADDFYHMYKDDVKLMKDIGLDAFRLSISWSRILPSKTVTIISITPFVTLFHWDLPQALEDEYMGFLSPFIVDDFRDFAEICFKEFGDRVKHWITVNEPFTFINGGGYDGGFLGNLAPGRCSSWANCPEGNSAAEPYVAGHHLLLCHASTVKLYKEKYQATQKGEIGITLVTHWMVPYSNSILDIIAAQRALDFIFGWFLHPIGYGYYPIIMQAVVGNRLPRFTLEQTLMLKGSFDFLGLNYYTGNYASHIFSPSGNVSSTTDQGVRLSSIGDQNNGTIENGIEDPQRIDFYNRHLLAVQESIKQGANVKGLFVWSFLDNFEWGSGYTLRFGICYVDYMNGG
ncbi:hypothetical protein BUALT_Bualt19G0041900 [Buddleja alternifolia]|uniref:Beta-glucosidase n=1 Tax=Buddleja alternifolia TaxID=168488 RepID=A0AAV6W9G9_9LAMI|nr:hypothetical protein BUALT_Bualt19G0041900 [Buddleja alternifolia]